MKQALGLCLKDSQIQEPQQTETGFKGMDVTGTAIAAAASALVGEYLIFYDRAGTSYAIWWDTAGGGSEPAAIDAAGVADGNTLEITGVGSAANANTVASTTASEMNASAKLNTKFEVVNASANNFAIYTLEVGPAQNPIVVDGSTGSLFSLTVTDGAGAPIKQPGNAQIALATAGDVTGVAAEVPLVDGTVPGQRAVIHVSTAASNGSIVLTGNFSDGGNHTRTKGTFGGSDNDEFTQLIWTGTDWANIVDDGVTFS